MCIGSSVDFLGDAAELTPAAEGRRPSSDTLDKWRADDGGDETEAGRGRQVRSGRGRRVWADRGDAKSEVIEDAKSEADEDAVG